MDSKYVFQNYDHVVPFVLSLSKHEWAQTVRTKCPSTGSEPVLNLIQERTGVVGHPFGTAI
jgi:hypothetical protein